MNLYQFLRMVDNSSPITIYDLQKNQLQYAFNKSAIETELLDYTVFCVGVNTIRYFNGEESCLCITIER